MSELSALIRFLHVLAAVLLTGHFAFEFLILRRVAYAAPTQFLIDAKNSWGQWTSVYFALAFLTHLAGLWVQTALISNVSVAAIDMGAVASLVSSTQVGKVWLARLFLFLFLGAFCWAMRRRLAAPGSTPSAIRFILSSFLLASLALSGHAAAAEGRALALQLGADALHLLAAGVWLGGLVPLTFLLRRCRSSVDTEKLTVTRKVVRQFSAIALMCVSGLLTTGAFNSWSLVGGLPQLFGTEYGRLLLGKLALVVAVLALGAVNLLRLKPRLGTAAILADRAPATDLSSLIRNVILEALLGVVILLIVGHMGVTPPARHVPPEWPFSFRWDWNLLDQAPRARQEAERGLAWVAVGGVALLGALLRRKRRTWAALIGVAALGYAGFVIHQVVAIDSYPTTYKRPAVSYNAISVANGKALYQDSSCAACHGPSGYGDGPLAEELKPKPADLTAPHANTHTAGDLYWWLSRGVNPSSAMPGYGNSLSDEEHWDLINYMRALSSGERARALAAVIEDKPWLAAPDFAYEPHTGAAKTLKDHRGNKIVLLVLLDVQSSEERLRELGKISAQLDAAEVEIVVVPNVSGRSFVDKQLSGLIVREGIREIAETYKLFASSLNSDHPITAIPHVEFLIDKQGYIRARWLPAESVGWRKFALLMQQVDALRQEKPSAPPPDEHVH